MLASAPAPSQDTSWFVGLGIGHMKTSDDCPVTAAPGANCEDEDTTWKIFGGYQFNTYLGVELGLVDMGERPTSLSGLGPASAKLRIFEVTLVGTCRSASAPPRTPRRGYSNGMPISNFRPVARDTRTPTETTIPYGLGVKYQLTHNSALRLEWQRYDDVGDRGTTGKFSVDVFGVGALFSF